MDKCNQGEFNNIINNNQLLSFNEKLFIEDNLKILNVFGSYLNIDYVKKNLQALKIEYYKENQELCDKNKNIKADYNPKTNLIRIYCANNIDECPKEVIMHELLHALVGGIKSGLVEAITESIICEYCNISKIKSRDYYVESLGLYSLIELIGVEPIIEFYCSGEYKYIQDKLDEITFIEDNLYIDFDNIMKTDKYTNKKVTCKMYDTFNKYFKSKYNKDIIYIPTVRTYLYNTFYNDTTEEMNNFTCKGYFVDEYIKNNPIISETEKSIVSNIFIDKTISIINKCILKKENKYKTIFNKIKKMNLH